MSQADYDALLAKQGGTCAICGKQARRLVVDHDHGCCRGSKTCGSCVRGLLCFSCNILVSTLERDPNWLTAAAQYLEKYEAELAVSNG
jgi:hypothetical protein